MTNLITGLFIFTLFFFLFNGIAYGEYILPDEGETYATYQVDLNGDGNNEKIIIKAYNVDKDNFTWLGQLIVYNSSGQKVWAGPKGEGNYSADPLVFGTWDYGYSLPQVVRDIDKDGKVEIIATCPVSDVRFTPFKLFRWDGKKFYTVYKLATLVQYPEDSGRYPWGNEEGYVGRYISEFITDNKDGTFDVFITDFTEVGGKTGQAVVAPDDEGFHICNWIEAPK